MKILNINSYYYSSSVYQPMEKNLESLGLEIDTYVPIAENYRGREDVNILPPSHVFTSVCFKKADRFLFHKKHAKIKKDFLQKFDVKSYDIIHAHSLFSNGYIAYSAKQKFNTPYIVAVRSTDINTFFKKMIYLRKLGVQILKEAQQIVFLSEKHLEYCLNNYIPKKYKKEIKKKANVIPNGIDDYWLENKLLIPKEPPKDTLKILFVGDDSKRKNLKKLIEACDILYNKGWDFELTIVGSLKNKDFLNRLKGTKYVKLKGILNKEKLLLEYRGHHIFVMPSISETFGLVYAEAMSQGLPVIYTANQGFDGQFDEGVVGYSVNCLSEQDIVSKITKTVKYYKMISNNSIVLVDKFSWKKVACEYKECYKNSIQNLI